LAPAVAVACASKDCVALGALLSATLDAQLSGEGHTCMGVGSRVHGQE